jgi:Sel1 repeat
MVSKWYVVTNSQNITLLSALLSSAAEAGDRYAQCYLGSMYRDGKGVEVNLVKAIEWYQKGTLSQILQTNDILNALPCQLQKLEIEMLNATLVICFTMEKELR